MLPDFLGIGAMRSGSTWLYTNLKRHPEVWLTPIKELHYFDKDKNVGLTNKTYRTRFLRRIRDYSIALIKQDKKVLADFSWDIKYFFEKRERDWYISLFKPNPGQIAGEITPAYTTLDIDTVKEIYQINSALKVIFFMRDPIERTWSQAVKNQARDKKRPVSSVPQEDFIRIFEREGAVLRSNYIRTLDIWEEVFGKEQIYIDYMDEIEQNPREVLLRLYRFLGISDDKRFVPENLSKKINNTDGYKTEIPQWVQTYLAHQHLPHLNLLSQRLGGHTTRWLQRAQSILNQKASN